MLNELEHNDIWFEAISNAEKERGFVAPGFNHFEYDSLKTLGFFMNRIEVDQNADDLITDIITNFIKSLEVKHDLSDIKESIPYAGFCSTNFYEIMDSIKSHNRRRFKKKETLDIKRNDKKNETIKKDLNRKIFIVHGHNDGMKEAAARFVEKLGFKGVILHEQPSEGKTIIEKFTKNSEVGFALVLLSGDDYGHKKNSSEGTARLRARQNVIFEMGYFIGKLGRNKVAAIHEVSNDFEFPSDYSGVLYIPFDENWKVKLSQELKAAGYAVDLNKIFD